MSANILFVCGSLNQTTMMHQIARQLGEHSCFFTPFYAQGMLGGLSRLGLMDFSILGGRHRRNTLRYLAQQGLPVDFGGQGRDYDLVVTCTDLIVQPNLRGKWMVLVQEGMIAPEGLGYALARYLKFPRYLADTAATGLSDAYDVFCVASPGFRDLFVRKGIKPEKLLVTGVPNFDHLDAYRKNDFPYHHFVLATTSSMRETFKWDDRAGFIAKARRIAAGRQLIFKLHPNEDALRARREIEQLAPEAMVLEDGNVHQMIANCDVLVSQLSSVVFTGLALGKEVHADGDLEAMRRLLPIQNGGASAGRIAEVCRRLLGGQWPESAATIGTLRARLGKQTPPIAG